MVPPESHVRHQPDTQRYLRSIEIERSRPQGTSGFLLLDPVMAAEVPAPTGAGPGNDEEPGIGSLGPPAEVEQLRAYLLRAVPVLLEEDVLPDTTSLEGLLKSSEARLKKFIEDPQERALYVLRTVPPELEGAEEEGETAGATEAGSFRPAYEVRLGLAYRPVRAVGVSFIKRAAILEADKSVRSQLRLINFSEDSPFETLHSYIRDAVTPYFTSYVATSKKTGYVHPFFRACMAAILGVP